MRIWLLVGAALSVVTAAPSSAQSVEAGIEAWQRGAPAEAVEIWRPLARSGDADAAFNLGQAYRLGRGVEMNLGAAQQWLDRAARKDHLDAQATLGLLLFESGNRQGGLRWLKTAAERGEPRALLVYGTALFNGDGVPRDPVLAYAYISRAAAQGLAPAKETLADLDQILPVEQRRKGVAMAIDKAKPAEPAAPPAVAPAPAQAQPQPAPKSRTPAPPAEPRAATGAWRIQLGAFSKRSSAETLFKRIAASASLAGRRPFYVASGALTKLQVGPFESSAAASAACKALEAKGQACFAVKAK